MGLLSGKFNLPLAGGLSPILTSAATSAGLAVATASQRVSETATKLLSEFGGVGRFGSIGAAAPSFEEVQARAALQLDPMSGFDPVYTPDQIAQQQIDVLRMSVDTNPSAAQVNQQLNKEKVDDSHLVKLSEQDTDLTVRFIVMPEISEQRDVEYEAVQPAQSPGAFQKYKATASTRWTINATLIARNLKEATDNLVDLNLLRGWTMPFFGQRTATSYPGKLGAPPPALMFSGFRKDLIGPVPVVITGLQWTFPKDIDWIPAVARDGTFTPFPPVLNISITLVESYSADQFNNFSLFDFREGMLDTSWNLSATTSLDTDVYGAGVRDQNVVLSNPVAGRTISSTDVRQRLSVARGVVETTTGGGAVISEATSKTATPINFSGALERANFEEGDTFGTSSGE